ncbi:SAM-dependent methyltransferase [Campylobacter upsaliensis]|uniref:SAM-dependent methyltransferase n=1 Tax=Campylobacter upsaliensis TaxID=28080 RepID=UPI002176CA3C|nr:SAM-dependent methyltransferase [Campylobacter upsaliensis]MEB2828306.1 SAM-dependent methyltransferase [Campylobacter upsaliensis]
MTCNLLNADNAKINPKRKLLSDFNLYLILRLPKSVFAPYTSIPTNLLFFNADKGGTEKTHFYRLDMPQNLKSFGKTKEMSLEHFEPFLKWW